MDLTPQDAPTSVATAGVDRVKYRQAGYGFFLLNLVYFVLFYHFLPPFNLGLTAYSSAAIYFLFLGLFTYLICGGARKTAVALALLFAGRALFSIYTLVTGQAFVAVPYVLPCLVITVYLLARAVWNWP
jgi:hypothetical protein